jgi:hypothetical protein
MSHCIYCNSSVYGRPCLFSPSNTHVHFDVANKCIYCGSRSLGGGCLYNPFNKNHVRGAEYLVNVKEQTEKSVILNYLYENLSNKEEEIVRSPLKRFYNRLHGIISEASQPLLQVLNLQVKPDYTNLTKEQNIKVFELRERLIEQYKEINKTIKHANLSLPQELVEEVLVDAIMLGNEDE